MTYPNGTVPIWPRNKGLSDEMRSRFTALRIDDRRNTLIKSVNAVAIVAYQAMATKPEILGAMDEGSDYGRRSRCSFWPAPTQFPKQCIRWDGSDPSGSAIARANKVANIKDIYIITGPNALCIENECLNRINNSQIIIEPSARNTAPCIAGS